MGVIESVEMHHFMCHPRLSFKFGPQINFIIGEFYEAFFSRHWANCSLFQVITEVGASFCLEAT